MNRDQDQEPLTAELIESTTHDGLTVERLLLQMPDGVVLPATRLTTNPAAPSTIMVRDQGASDLDANDEQVRALINEGRTVLAVDLRGTGRAAPASENWYGRFGREGRDAATAYILGRPFLSLQAADLAACAHWLGTKPDVIAQGRIGVAALHAVALGPDVFGRLTLRRCINSWEQIIAMPGPDAYFSTTVHDALNHYDLPDLADALGDRLRIEEPVIDGLP